LAARSLLLRFHPRKPKSLLGSMLPRLNLLLSLEMICKYKSVCISYILCTALYSHLFFQSSLLFSLSY
jgi:hypothetical protein